MFMLMTVFIWLVTVVADCDLLTCRDMRPLLRAPCFVVGTGFAIVISGVFCFCQLIHTLITIVFWSSKKPI